jgi:HAMP domain-containing protein
LALGAAAVAWIDFEEAGRRAGRLAARVAAGTSPRELPVEMLDEGRVARSTTARRR